MSKSRRTVLIVGLIIVVAVVLLLISDSAPTTTSITTDDSGQTASEELPCLTAADDACLQLPAVVGTNINNAEVAFPDAFSTDYTLVVMPFDREQQVLAVTWLPVFQDMATPYDNVGYYNIAALPDLAPLIRVAVIGGMSAGVSEDAVRDVTTVLFLEDQATFLDALAIDNSDDIQVFIMDNTGTIYWRGVGEYHEALAHEMQTALAQLAE